MRLFFFSSLIQDFSANLTAYQHARLASVVGGLAQDFNDAYARIVQSESAYSEASGNMERALQAVPVRLSAVRDTLANYQADSAGLRDSALKMAADEVFLAVNESISIGSSAIASALPVSVWPSHDPLQL